MSDRLTARQREVLATFEGTSVDSRRRVQVGADYQVAMNLTRKGLLNVDLNDDGNEVFWLRAPGEEATGPWVAVGFIVVLNTNVESPGGNFNFFLGRMRHWDLTQGSFRKALRRWLTKLGLTTTNLNMVQPSTIVSYDDRIFTSGKYVVLED